MDHELLSFEPLPRLAILFYLCEGRKTAQMEKGIRVKRFAHHNLVLFHREPFGVPVIRDNLTLITHSKLFLLTWLYITDKLLTVDSSEKWPQRLPIMSRGSVSKNLTEDSLR